MDIELLLDHNPPSARGALTLRALLRVSGTAPKGTDRTPLNLALVLDRSSSMAGQKLENAKDAAALLVRRIWSEDRVGIVAYGSDVTTLVSGAVGDGHGKAETRIREIHTSGCTNLSGGWLRGRDLVQNSLVEVGMNRILLLTDGQANQGITDRDQLTGLCGSAREAGITTTTIGFGEDFDEDLLRAMADAGGGGAYYIENPDQAPGIFEEEVEGLLSLAAQNVAVEVIPGPDIALAAVRHSYPGTRNEGTLRLDVGDLYAREPRLVLMEFLLPHHSPGAAVDVASIRVQGHVLTERGGVEQRTIDLPVRLSFGDGPLVDPEVRRVTLLLDAADARERAVRLQTEGDWDGAGRVLREAAEALELEMPNEPVAEREARGLRESAGLMTPHLFDSRERKYLKQHAHDQMRSRSLPRERYSRE